MLYAKIQSISNGKDSAYAKIKNKKQKIKNSYKKYKNLLVYYHFAIY
ncbi:hypothetical protein KAU19_00905 [Candidatus Parcubacteria bacterium]|nr:hypothetical protein [Candidatus Parcubacteria bacterium]